MQTRNAAGNGSPNTRCRGTLNVWNDDRGFGFIQPEAGGATVFLHIGALAGSPRRPQVGDTIFYDRQVQSDGRLRAANATIAGVARPTVRRESDRNPYRTLSLVLGLLVIAMLAGSVFYMTRQPAPKTDPLPARVESLSPPKRDNKESGAVTVDRSPSAKSAPKTKPQPKVQAKKPVARSRTEIASRSEEASAPFIPDASNESQDAVSTHADEEIDLPDTAPQEEAEPHAGALIKGNISVGTGEKLYHLPNMRDYHITVINPRRGERWFRTEEEAIQAGWRKAPR